VVDLTKPCVKCGVVDRYSSGNCRPCQKTLAAKYRQSDEGRAKARAYRQSDEYRAKAQAYRQSDEYRAKARAYSQSDQGIATIRKYSQSDKGRAKARAYSQSVEGRASKVKHKKTLFEFSLQNQQKVIKQCQQNLTQPNETN
jgi:hypothetical protein